MEIMDPPIHSESCPKFYLLHNPHRGVTSNLGDDIRQSHHIFVFDYRVVQVFIINLQDYSVFGFFPFGIVVDKFPGLKIFEVKESVRTCSAGNFA